MSAKPPPTQSSNHLHSTGGWSPVDRPRVIIMVFRAKRNATALHNRCLFRSWQNHPQRWGEKRDRCTQLTHSAHVCNLWVTDNIQHWRKSKDPQAAKKGFDLKRQFNQKFIFFLLPVALFIQLDYHLWLIIIIGESYCFVVRFTKV